MHVTVIAIVVVEEESQRAATWQTCVLIDATRIIQGIALDRDASCETKQSCLIHTGGVLQLVAEEDVQDRVNYVPCRFFRQFYPANSVVSEACLPWRSVQLIPKAVAFWHCLRLACVCRRRI